MPNSYVLHFPPLITSGVKSHELTWAQNIDPEDHATLDTLALGAEAGSGGRTLADIIFSKMEGGAATSAIETDGMLSLHHPCPSNYGRLQMLTFSLDGGPPDPRKGLNPKVVEVYTK